MSKVDAVKIHKPLSENQFNRLMVNVSGKKIIGFRRFEDAQRTLIGKILTQYLICQKLNIQNNELRFRSNRYGKPYLLCNKGFHFNISHSGDWVVCCIDNLPVGIDIEQVEPIDIDIAERFFSEEEAASIRAKEHTQQIENFYELWTLKESYVKAIGKGLFVPLNSFTIKIDKDRIALHTINKRGKYYFKLYELSKGYKMGVCTKSNSFEESVQIYGVDELYENFLSIL